MKAKAFAGLLMLAALAACGNEPAGPDAQSAAAPALACDKRAENTLMFSDPATPDIIETRAFGPAANCSDAIVIFTLRKADGAPLWAWATPYGWPGDRSINGSAFAPGAMETFLEQWASPKVDTTASLPDWPERETVFAGSLGAYMHTPFDRDQYLDIRAKAAPRLCHATGIESATCIFADPDSGAVLEVFRSGA